MFDADDDGQRESCRFLIEALIEPGRRTWRQVLKAPGLAVWSSGGPSIDSTAGADGPHGIALGRIVPSACSLGGVDEDGGISRALAAEIFRSRGSILGSKCWGGYVAFACDPDSPGRCVARDPTGTIPCYWVGHGGVKVFFSDVNDIRPSGLWSLRANYDYLRVSVLLPRIQKTLTGLENVHEVLPGEFLTNRASSDDRAFIWNPYDHVPVGDVDPDTAAATIRRAIEGTVWELVRPYRRIVHNIGGLDSSILHACLATAPSNPEVTLLNYTTASRRGDERCYVREMATRYRDKLIERPLDPGSIGIDELATTFNQVSPLGTFDCLDRIGKLYDLEEARRADAFFYGVGGDNVFLQAAGLLPLLDYVNANGFGVHFLRMAANAMRETRRSARDIAREVLREKRDPLGALEAAYFNIFIPERWPGYNPELLAGPLETRSLHPLLVPAEHVPKGKYFQIISTCFCPIEYYDQFAPDVQKERIHVYFSQPIVEACLGIPSWHFAMNGIERGLARYAFNDVLPERVSRRLTKSTPTEVYESMLDREFDKMREFLLDGVLVRNHILSRKSLEEILSQEFHEIPVAPTAVFGFFSWEAWARNWA